MSEMLTWGILGTGDCANAFARDLASAKTGTLQAVGSRTRASSLAFGQIWNVPHCYDSYDLLLKDASVQAIYIATPNSLHAEWAIKAAEAGKHILCEKPIAVNHTEALAMVNAARRHAVCLMEGFAYRYHPQTMKLVELVQSGIIGKIHVIQATNSFRAQYVSTSRLFDKELGGGCILDVGCYCASIARLIAGAAIGKEFANPIHVAGAGYIGELSQVDEYATAVLIFPENIIAQLFSGFHGTGDNVVRIFGSKGSILVPSPWTAALHGGTSTIIVKQEHKETAHEILVECSQPLFAREADVVAASIEMRQSPAMSWDDILGNAATLDQWRAALEPVESFARRNQEIS